MNSMKVKELLEKYFEGLTSSEEERQLENYFHGEEVDSELLAEKDMFLFYQSEKEESSEYDEIESLILETIEEKEQERKSPGKSRTLFYFAQAAAVLVILIGSYFIIENMTDSQDMGTFDDPKLAMAETQRVLNILSETMNTGTKELSSVKAFDVVQNELGKTKSLEKVDKELNKIGEVGKGFEELNNIIGNVINSEK